jgi:hypothetical protein
MDSTRWRSDKFLRRDGFIDEEIDSKGGIVARKKTAEFRLPIFKQGDDLGHCLAECDTVRGALLAYAAMLNEAREMVVALAEHADHLEITQADTHFIAVEGPAKLVDQLIENGLLASEQADDEDH